MNNLWLKIRIWTKVAAFGFFLVYALTFVLINYSTKVTFWVWFRTEPTSSVLGLALGAFLLGIVGTILVSTTFRTVKQVQELRTRNRAEKIERQVAEMQQKAGRLQTRETSASDHSPEAFDQP